MQIKPVKMVKPVNQSLIGRDADVVQKPQTKASRAPQEESGLSLNRRALLFNGKDVGQLITELAKTNPQMLSQIANELEKYKKNRLKNRNRAAKKEGRTQEQEEADLSLVWGLCDAYIARIAHIIKKRFDQAKDGLSVLFDEDGQLILNGINVHALLEKCREETNPKSRLLLKGLRARLELILHNRYGNPYYAQIRDIVLSLFDEIGVILSGS